MYEAHFGLQGRPFDTGIAHDVDVFRGGRQNTVIDKAKLALAARDSVVTFCGPPGVGKTTLALAAIRSISTRLALAWLSSMPTNPNEMLELLLVELGINAHRATRVERLQMWRQYLEEMSATQSRVFVIAERTEEFAPEVLRALDALTGTDASGSPGANVVLLGHQGLDAFLGSPSLESLRQRIRLRQRFEPFSAAELTDYLRHRVTQVGGDFERLFAPGAAAAVYRLSAGVARVANTLCEAALTAAAATNKSALTPELIIQVSVDMLGLVEQSSAPQAQAAPTPPVAPVATTGAVTIGSVAIDITPAKAAAVVAAPKNASAAPRAVEAPIVPAAAPITPVPPPAVATAPITAAATRVDVTPTPAVVTPTPASVPEQPVAPVAQAVAPRPAPAPAPAPIAAAVVAPASVTAPAPSAAATKTAAPRMALPDFDATATDIPDVSSFDFPVLTDAVEATAQRAPLARAPVTPPSAPITPALAAKPLVAPPPVPRAATPPVSRPAAAIAATPPSSRRLLEPKVAAPSAPPPPPAPKAEEEPDLQRQTQTMRAISMAKSIDDVSDSMAETLFGEAELDFLSAALASAVGESDDSALSAAAARAATPPPTESPVDDLMDLFNLGPDAPLELIDDSAAPESDQRTARRRS